MILVTGGCGFIGSSFILDWLARTDEAVLNLDLLTYAGHPGNLASVEQDSRHLFVRGDIGDTALVARLLAAHRPRAIVHFAAETHVDRSLDGPLAFVRTNTLGTAALLAQALAYWQSMSGDEAASFRFINVSTDEVYGALGPDDAPFTESHPFEPSSPYAASKAGADHMARAWHHSWGLPVITTHCSNNYGPRQFPEKLIPLVVHNATSGRPLPVYGDGRQVRDWLHVSDHCAALRLVLDTGRPGRSYNIGGHCERSNLDIVHGVCATLDNLRPRSDGQPHAAGITHVKDRRGHDRRYAIDTARIGGELGWQPVQGFEDGLRATVEWYLSHPAWVASATSGAYREWVGRQYGTSPEGAA